MRKNLLLSAFGLLLLAQPGAAKPKEIKLDSPDGRITVAITLDEKISYSVLLNGKALFSDPGIALHLQDGTILGANPKLAKQKTRTVDEEIDAPFHRNPRIKDQYNEVDLKMKGNYGVRFRAYDNGVAYRFYTQMKDSIVIAAEDLTPTFPADCKSWLAYSTNPKKPMAMAFQNYFTEATLSQTDPQQLAFPPFAVEVGEQTKVVFAEADLEAYPGVFFRPQPQKHALAGVFPEYPKEMDVYPWRVQDYVVSTEENCIARCAGTRQFPWRAWAISEQDTELPANNLVYLLASPNRIGDVSWVKPGKVAWDWWNDWGLSGVDFKAGINTATYKYYIDFASRYGLEYIILDEGWYDPKSGDMLTVIPELNLKEVVDYGKSKGVGVVLWTVFNVIDRQLEEACTKYAAMGVKGFKIDFLDRCDQTAVERLYRIAEATAKHHLFVDYHGLFTPTGLQRTYPHVLNFEAVFGQEEVKWEPVDKDMPRYNVTFPYLRMMCGPVDYTPGAMHNATKKDWRPMYYTPQSMGTRAHQAACYVVFDSPFTMLCDAPTEYEREPEYTKFIASIPTVFDETRIIAGRMGESIVTARRKGSDWYVGALTNWDERTLQIALDFLEEGKTYELEYLEDGINAGKRANDYKINRLDKVNSSCTATLKLASGGGAVFKFKEKR
ncbi:MAG: glycoside hydrolase family 97 protein [Bacteroidaceae bacterium]|jgi:alpha-glucosidase